MVLSVVTCSFALWTRTVYGDPLFHTSGLQTLGGREPFFFSWAIRVSLHLPHTTRVAAKNLLEIKLHTRFLIGVRMTVS